MVASGTVLGELAALAESSVEALKLVGFAANLKLVGFAANDSRSADDSRLLGTVTNAPRMRCSRSDALIGSRGPYPPQFAK